MTHDADEVLLTAELCRPHDAAEAMLVESELRDQGIAVALAPLTSTAYGGIGASGRWGSVRVPERDLPRARKILEALRETLAALEPDEEALERAALEAEVVEDAALAKRDALRRGSPETYRGPAPTPSSAPRRVSWLGCSMVLNAVLGCSLVVALRDREPGQAATAERADALGAGQVAARALDRDGDGHVDRWESGVITLEDLDDDGVPDAYRCGLAPRVTLSCAP